ncbi:hypothetical protein FNF07_04360 [Trinickia caryophylli]|uniref:Uncharacterized protein n=1 Tax=Trinickia caryophylli TaxID=28094 RepID=A0A1X7GAI6_TRICW|nr:hypothetical protein C0Z17_14445 [Trinickia caryophylli]TRX17537.1 hypothetical protein FNF07_04360 [Trinickia caryophylli]SMF66742.1 hypothetical protein SAMN06295900_114147 [Trinickia caryophylli]
MMVTKKSALLRTFCFWGALKMLAFRDKPTRGVFNCTRDVSSHILLHWVIHPRNNGYHLWRSTSR